MLTYLPAALALIALVLAATRKPQPHKSHHRRNVDTLDVRPFRKD